MIIVEHSDLALKVCLTCSLFALLFSFYILADNCWLSGVNKMTTDKGKAPENVYKKLLVPIRVF